MVFLLYFGQHGSLFTEDLGQAACVNAGDAWHVGFSEPVGERLDRIPVAVVLTVFTHNQAICVYFFRFEKFLKLKFVLLRVGNTVIADQWICEHEYLILV